MFRLTINRVLTPLIKLQKPRQNIFFKNFLTYPTINYFSSQDNLRQARELVLKGLQQVEHGNYNAALDFFKSSNDVFINAGDESNPSLIHNYSHMGSIYYYQKDYTKAATHFEKALEISKKHYPEDHPITLGIYKMYALNQEELHHYDQSIGFYSKVLASEIKNQSFDPLAVCKTHNKIGLVYLKKKDYSNALKEFEKGLAIERQFWHTKDRCLGLSYTNMGILFKETREYDQAIHNLNEALKIKLAAIGEKDLVAASIFQTMGEVLILMNKPQHAIGCFVKVYNIESQLLNKNSPRIAQTCEKIAELTEKDRPDEALKYLKLAIEIRNNKKEENTKELKALNHRAGALNSKLGNQKEAEKFFEEAKSF